MRNSFTGLVDYPTALQLVLACAEKRSDQAENVPLSHSNGRIAAQDVLAVSDRPVADISAMDGYAFAHSAMAAAPAGLRVVGQKVAGDMPSALKMGEAQGILTGARIPPGADCVMAGERMQLDLQTECVRPLHALAEQGANIRRKGEEFTRGTCLVRRGQALDWRHIALLASQNVQHVAVVRPLRIAVVANGAELAADAPDARADSNTPMLAALLASAGAEVETHVVSSDDADQLRAVLCSAWEHSDMLVTTGGISVGDTDNVLDVLKELGAGVLFRGVKIRPGKPLSILEQDGKLAFCLPGNPGASAVCALVFLLPYLRSVMGDAHRPVLIAGTVDFELASVCDTTHFVPVFCQSDGLGWRISLLPTVGASDIIVLTRANALLRVDPHAPVIAGQTRWVMPLHIN
ncbi:molybdopterin molybdotransferase MoeA [Acetobacter senegalensis]|uniref:molybdopterin molybdotransferase MoeA n=1 Tax=Acetobacter senegalensis TaxID=446692 RepID=UPI00264D7F34|nr:molybdopterin molybdotransferase MoeA [Acetobacter senegalensis]MDN7356309.1 molybdopterin molybdotransferase MoeA [Acetobacter senegalensis]